MEGYTSSCPLAMMCGNCKRTIARSEIDGRGLAAFQQRLQLGWAKGPRMWTSPVRWAPAIRACPTPPAGGLVTANYFRRPRRLRIRWSRDLSCKPCRNFGVRLGVKVNTVPLVGVRRDWFRVIDNDADTARTQPVHHRGDIGGALLLGAEKAKIVGAGLQDDNRAPRKIATSANLCESDL
jgi:hypothetical protein